MSPEKASGRGSPKTNVADWDIACYNCGRYGTFPGQMMTDHLNRTFCSPDCGWSYVLRPTEEARAAKAMRAMQVARANQQQHDHHHRRSRSKRSSRHAYMAHQLRGQAQHDSRPAKHVNAPRPHSPSSADKPPRGPSTSSSSSSSSACPAPSPPPRTASNLDRRAESSTRRSSSKRYSSNAMFEYSMAYHNMSLHT